MWGGEVLEEELSTWLCKILRFINKCEELETLKWPPYWHFFDNNLCIYISYQSFQNLYKRPKDVTSRKLCGMSKICWTVCSLTLWAIIYNFQRSFKYKEGWWINDRLTLVSQCEFFPFFPQAYFIQSIIRILSREFPGSPVVRTPRFQCQGPGFNHWSGN